MVIDDAAVTPRYVVGFTAERELPIVGKIAIGSLRNKLLILLPAALALSYFLPSADHAAADDRRRLSLLRGRREGLRGAVPARGARTRGRARHASALDPQIARRREGRRRDQDRLHPLGRDHGDHARGRPASDFWTQALVLAVVGVGITVGGLRRGRADRESRRRRRGAGHEPERLGDRRRPRRSAARSSSACRYS